MNLMRHSRGWVRDCCLLPSPGGASPNLQIIEFKQRPNTHDEVAVAVLSDGENYISARLTAACRSLCMTEFDTDILDARGAIVLLRKWERIASPSFSEFLLVVDELTHMGADGSLPFHSPTNVNALPAVQSALHVLKEDRGGPDNDDMMMLMANMLAHERPDPRTPLPKDLHFSFEDTVIPADQLRELARVPGWKSALTSADDEPAPASGSSRPSPDGIESSDESSNPNGNYNFVDGVNVALGPVSRHSPSLEPPSQEAGAAVAVSDEDEMPSFRAPSPPPPEENDDDDDDAPPDADALDNDAAAVISDEEEMPLFHAPKAQHVAADDEPAGPNTPLRIVSPAARAQTVSPSGWTETKVQSLCRALRMYGDDWEAVALRIESNPIECERFYRQYEQFVPSVRAALTDYRLRMSVMHTDEVADAPDRKRARTHEPDENANDDDDDDEEFADERNYAMGAPASAKKFFGTSRADVPVLQTRSKVRVRRVNVRPQTLSSRMALAALRRRHEALQAAVAQARRRDNESDG